MVDHVFTGGDALKAKLAEMAKKIEKAAEVRVGWGEDATEENGQSTAMVAAIQEYGAPAKGIPPRPFFRPMVAKESPSWGGKVEAALVHTDFDAAKALDLVGEDIAGALADSIRDVTSPALSDVTLLLRQRFGNSPGEITFADVMKARHDIASGTVPKVTDTQAHPLIWTGHMLNSIKVTVK